MPNNQSTVVEYSITETDFANILVATTERGVCAVLLGDTAAELLADLQQRWPKAQLISNEPGLAPLLNNIIEFL